VTEPLFHLAQPSDWARSVDVYSPASVEEEGFVHCSTEQQLPDVARTLYSDRNDLILLTIDPDLLEEGSLVYEDLYEMGQEFPHIYGPLPCRAVVTTGPYLNHLEECLWLDNRFDREWMDRILHPDFSEVGMSGRTYTRDEFLGVPRVEFSADLPHEDYRFDLIDEDVGLARYTSHDTQDGVERHAQRSSVWVNTNEGWRLRFHQGTPVP
jgi:uncharacterized protein (DUF952 family)